MGQRCLVMITDTFPFDVGEEFLEQEIELVAARFDKVLIIPVRTRADRAKQTRKLPPNAVAVAPAPATFNDWRVNTVLRAPQIVARAATLYANMPWNHAYRTLMDARFAANAMDIFTKIPRIISPQILSGFDSVVFYAYWMHTPAVVACLMRDRMLADPKRGVVVSRAHAYDVDESDAPAGYVPARRYLLDHLDHVYPISDYAARFLYAHGERHPGQIQVRRLGVPQIPPITRLRTKPLRMLSCSHVAPYKRIDLMLEAVAELERRGTPVSWTHVGESNPERLEAMRVRASELLRSSEVEFTGHLPNEKARAIYADPSYGVFVNTSDGEGVPVSIMEAQAAGLPVVATNAGGTAEIVLDGVNGTIVPVESSAAMIADAINAIAELSDDEFQTMSETARAGWAERSCAPRQYADFADHLEELSRKAAL